MYAAVSELLDRCEGWGDRVLLKFQKEEKESEETEIANRSHQHPAIIG